MSPRRTTNVMFSTPNNSQDSLPPSYSELPPVTPAPSIPAASFVRAPSPTAAARPTTSGAQALTPAAQRPRVAGAEPQRAHRPAASPVLGDDELSELRSRYRCKPSLIHDGQFHLRDSHYKRLRQLVDAIHDPAAMRRYLEGEHPAGFDDVLAQLSAYFAVHAIDVHHSPVSGIFTREDLSAICRNVLNPNPAVQDELDRLDRLSSDKASPGTQLKALAQRVFASASASQDQQTLVIVARAMTPFLKGICRDGSVDVRLQHYVRLVSRDPFVRMSNGLRSSSNEFKQMFVDVCGAVWSKSDPDLAYKAFNILAEIDARNSRDSNRVVRLGWRSTDKTFFDAMMEILATVRPA